MSHLALKDLFSGFFVIDDEEEVEVPDKQQQVNEAPAKEQSQQTTKQNAIKSVPQKSASRYTTTSEERNNRMSNYSKNNSRNVVTMNNATPNNASQESSKMCLFEPRVFSDTQDIADELKNRRATLVNLQRIDKVSAKRIIDFLSGTVYAIGGDIQRVGTDIFLCTPDNVEVAGSITDHIEHMDINVLATIFKFILFVVEIYYFGMIIYFFTSWVPSIRETKVGYFLAKIYEPFLQPFRKVIPPIGIIDISSIAAIIVLVLFQKGLLQIFNWILIQLQ